MLRVALGAGCALLFLSQMAVAQGAQTVKGKLPVIVVPGLTGSELVNSKTKEVVWFNALRSKVDDIRLPISPDIAANHDDLIATDILRTVKVGPVKIDGYQGLITALQERGGYTEGSWDAPAATGYQDTCYVFYYDWRRDNVENARLLVRKVEELKRKLNRPDLKFDIVAHSMGGIVARYAAMYGDVDLPAGKAAPRPTWAGARDFNEIILLGVPNEGAASAFGSLLNGFAIGGLTANLPFLQNPSKFDIFTLPAAYQLLPDVNTLQAFDENLKPVKIDLYDSQTWTKYGWGALEDKDFDKSFLPAEKAGARAYFINALDRAKHLYQALDASSSSKLRVAMDVLGGDCKDTLDSIVIYRDGKTGAWKTLFKPEAFTRSDGTRVSADELRKVMYAPGDSVVTKRSLTAATVSQRSGVASIFFPRSTSFLCEIHNRQQTNDDIQDKIIALLANGGLAGNTNSRYISVTTN
jgi:pimeloyl-ACP methyl ester carboxylesterase